MEKISARTRQYALWVALICTLLFASFSISYLMLQGEAIRSIHGVMSEGKTVYSPVYGAVIITFVLWLVQWGLNRLTRFRHAWQAVSYLPAYLLLTLLSCYRPNVMTDGHTFVLRFYDGLGWGCLAVLLLYVLVAICYRKTVRSDVNKTSFQQMIIPNLLVMILFTYATGFVGNNNERLHNELSIAQCIRTGDYEQALSIGRKSLHNSHTLTTLRAIALSQCDSLGQALFRYPQSDGAEGLFFDESKGETSSFTNADIYTHLGGIARKGNETPVHYLRRICEQGGSHKALDYYLSALLLERQLEAFVDALVIYREEEALPRHYQEALLLYEQRLSASPQNDGTLLSNYFALIPEDVRQSYTTYKALQQEYPQPIPQRNYTRRKFGDTYWWYYQYGE